MFLALFVCYLVVGDTFLMTRAHPFLFLLWQQGGGGGANSSGGGTARSSGGANRGSRSTQAASSTSTTTASSTGGAVYRPAMSGGSGASSRIGPSHTSPPAHLAASAAYNPTASSFSSYGVSFEEIKTKILLDTEMVRQDFFIVSAICRCGGMNILATWCFFFPFYRRKS